MSELLEDNGVCPCCSASGEVGSACPESACVRWEYHRIPKLYSDRVQADPELRSDTLIGRRFGDYLLIDRIGSGGFGRVYLALQLPIGMRVALKVLRSDVRYDLPGEELRERFQREAQALAELTHPNIVRLIVYGVGEGEGTPYLVTEFVSNARTLKQAMRERRDAGEDFSVREIRHIIRQTVNALAAAHERNIVHRDIKPENIMLQEVAGDPHFVRVLDFGLVKFLGDTTITGMVLGTPTYISPEQLSGGQIGPWTDLYALAVLAFRMVTGRNPFGSGGNDAIIGRKLTDDFNPLDDLPSDTLTPAASAFFRQALARLPEARFRTAEDFRAGLEKAFDDLEDRGNTRPVSGGERAARLRAAPDSSPDETSAAPYASGSSGATEAAPSTGKATVEPSNESSVTNRTRVSEPSRFGAPGLGAPGLGTASSGTHSAPIPGGTGTRYPQSAGSTYSGRVYPPSEAVSPRAPGYDGHSVDRPARGRVLIWIFVLVLGIAAIGYGIIQSGVGFGRRATVKLQSNVSGATVRVDGEHVGQTSVGQPVEVPAALSAKKIEVVRPGYRPWEQSIEGAVQAGATFRAHLSRASANEAGMETIPSGAAWLGCESKGDCADVPLGRQEDVPGFAIDLREVTVANYKECVAAKACDTPKSKGVDGCNWGKSRRSEHPINCVSATDAMAYCAWAGRALPTAAEWEKAARGGCELHDDCEAGSTRFPWGNDAPGCDRANFDDGRVGAGCGADGTVPTGTIRGGQSPYGIYDMGGNVAEWVMISSEAKGEFRLKGGSYASLARDLRIAATPSAAADFRAPTTGFRCVVRPD